MIPGMASITVSMPLLGDSSPNVRMTVLSGKTEFRFGVMRFDETESREFRAV